MLASLSSQTYSTEIIQARLYSTETHSIVPVYFEEQENGTSPQAQLSAFKQSDTMPILQKQYAWILTQLEDYCMQHNIIMPQEPDEPDDIIADFVSNLSEVSRFSLFYIQLFHRSGYYDKREGILLNTGKKLFETLLCALHEPQIQLDQKKNMLVELQLNITYCADGVISHLTDCNNAIISLKNTDTLIATTKIEVIEQITKKYIELTHGDVQGNEIHYINAYLNSISMTYYLPVRDDDFISLLKIEDINKEGFKLFLKNLLTPELVLNHLSVQLNNALSPLLQKAQTLRAVSGLSSFETSVEKWNERFGALYPLNMNDLIEYNEATNSLQYFPWSSEKFIAELTTHYRRLYLIPTYPARNVLTTRIGDNIISDLGFFWIEIANQHCAVEVQHYYHLAAPTPRSIEYKAWLELTKHLLTQHVNPANNYPDIIDAIPCSPFAITQYIQHQQSFLLCELIKHNKLSLKQLTQSLSHINQANEPILVFLETYHCTDVIHFLLAKQEISQKMLEAESPQTGTNLLYLLCQHNKWQTIRLLFQNNLLTPRQFNNDEMYHSDGSTKNIVFHLLYYHQTTPLYSFIHSQLIPKDIIKEAYIHFQHIPANEISWEKSAPPALLQLLWDTHCFPKDIFHLIDSSGVSFFAHVAKNIRPDIFKILIRPLTLNDKTIWNQLTTPSFAHELSKNQHVLDTLALLLDNRYITIEQIEHIDPFTHDNMLLNLIRHFAVTTIQRLVPYFFQKPTLLDNPTGDSCIIFLAERSLLSILMNWYTCDWITNRQLITPNRTGVNAIYWAIRNKHSLAIKNFFDAGLFSPDLLNTIRDENNRSIIWWMAQHHETQTFLIQLAENKVLQTSHLLERPKQNEKTPVECLQRSGAFGVLMALARNNLITMLVPSQMTFMPHGPILRPMLTPPPYEAPHDFLLP